MLLVERDLTTGHFAGSDGPEQGVIEEARRRQRRRRTRTMLATLTAAAVVGVIVSGLGGGSGRGGGGSSRTAEDSWLRASIGNGITISYPRDWHLFAPPVTSLTYPYDRMLLTSYRTRVGGDCSPTRAEKALPTNGVLMYLFEYSATPGGAFGRSQGMEFPPQSAGSKLRRGDLGSYECWTVPSYMTRFRVAGRDFQVHVALGAHATSTRRAQAQRVLRSLRVQALA